MFIQLSSVIALDKGQCDPPGSWLLSYKSLELLEGQTFRLKSRPVQDQLPKEFALRSKVSSRLQVYCSVRGELSESVPASNAINARKRDCFYIFTDSCDYASLRKASTSSSVFAKMILAPKFISFFSKNS